jgi:pyruvate-formate lyase
LKGVVVGIHENVGDDDDDVDSLVVEVVRTDD